MDWSQINTRPSRRQLIVFGISWLIVFGALGAMTGCRVGSWTVCGVLWALAAGVPAAGCVVPGFMRIVYVAMSCATFPIGYVLTILILATVYYLVLTPTGLIMRLLGRDPMRRRFDPDAGTYWTARRQSDDPQKYLRQF